MGILGPSLIDLGLMTGASTSELSTVFLMRGILAIIGSLALGPLLDRINLYVVVGASLLFDVILHGFAPWFNNLTAVLCALGPPELFNCAIGMGKSIQVPFSFSMIQPILTVAGTHLICIQIWKEKAGPSLQLLNLISVLGFMLGPLMVSPFLASTPDLPCPPCSNHTNMTSIQSNPDDLIHQVTQVYVSYIIVALYSLFISGLLLVAFLIDGGEFLRDRIVPAEDKSKIQLHHDRHFILKVCISFFGFNLFFGGLEVGYPGMLMSFAVKHLHWEKHQGAYIISLLQGVNALVTAMAIFLAKFIKPQIILAADAAIVTSALLLLVIMVESYPIILWITTAILGVGIATVMPSTFTWATTFMEVTGSFSGVYWCGYFTGFMVVPALTGYLSEAVHQMCFVYVMLGCGIAMSFLLILLYQLVEKHSRKVGENI